MKQNIETIQQIYACFGQGDVPGILSRLSADVEWEPETTDQGIPWIRPGRGHAAALAFFGVLGEALEFHAFAPEAMLSDARSVAVVVRHDFTVRATGRRVAGLEIHHWTFDDQGRVASLRHFVDTAAHLAAATA